MCYNTDSKICRHIHSVTCANPTKLFFTYVMSTVSYILYFISRSEVLITKLQLLQMVPQEFEVNSDHQ